MIHLLNFKKQFVASVIRGDKRQTMRPRRKRPIAAGDTLRLYTGLRQTGATLLREVVCEEVRSVQLDENGIYFPPVPKERGSEFLPGKSQEATKLACADGFGTYEEMFAFFTKLYGAAPIKLDIIKWKTNE